MDARTIRFAGREYKLIDEVVYDGSGVAVFVRKELGFCHLIAFDWVFYESTGRCDLRVDSIPLSNSALTDLMVMFLKRSETA